VARVSDKAPRIPRRSRIGERLWVTWGPPVDRDGVLAFAGLLGGIGDDYLWVLRFAQGDGVSKYLEGSEAIISSGSWYVEVQPVGRRINRRESYAVVTVPPAARWLLTSRQLNRETGSPAAVELPRDCTIHGVIHVDYQSA